MPIALTVLSLAAAAFCLFLLLLVRKDIRSLTRQLRSYNDGESSGKVTTEGMGGGLEALAAEINRHTDLILQARAERMSTENELRAAVANISHDLRTPLTSISGYIQLLDSKELTEERRREAIGVIRKRTLRLQSLLNDFYELSLIDSPDYVLKPVRLRLDRIIPEMLMGFYDGMQESGLQPVFELTDIGIEIWGDESAVRRVIENLLANAVRHASGKLEVSLYQRNEDVIFSLANSAPRLHGSDPELLFNRFYMADHSRSGLSSGLGLSIARELMAKMGGSLKAAMQEDVLCLTCTWKKPPGALFRPSSD